RFSIRSTKHVIAPNGAAGGGDGRTGDIIMNPETERQKRLPTRYADYPLGAHDSFRLDTPGGGGLGDALKRDPARVLRDVQEGYITSKAADETYGVVVKHDADGWTIDVHATESRRRAAMNA